MNDNKKFWQRFAGLYSPFMERGNRQLYEIVCTEVTPYLRSDMTVLEIIILILIQRIEKLKSMPLRCKMCVSGSARLF